MEPATDPTPSDTQLVTTGPDPCALPSPRAIEALIALIDRELNRRPDDGDDKRTIISQHAPSSLEWCCRLLSDPQEIRSISRPILRDLRVILPCWLVSPAALRLDAVCALWGATIIVRMQDARRTGGLTTRALREVEAICTAHGHELTPRELEKLLINRRQERQRVAA